jgi:hypothetical protein
MKTILLTVSVIFLLLVGIPICSQMVVQNLSASQPSTRPLLATEQEVKQFFENYIERYTRKNIDNFLWLFSPKAVQNQKDGLPRIREVYANFFDQSQALRYRLEDQKIEIYENAVEVKARYEIEQIVKRSEVTKILRGWIRWVLIKEGGILKISSIDYQNEKAPLKKEEAGRERSWR